MGCPLPLLIWAGRQLHRYLARNRHQPISCCWTTWKSSWPISRIPWSESSSGACEVRCTDPLTVTACCPSRPNSHPKREARNTAVLSSSSGLYHRLRCRRVGSGSSTRSATAAHLRYDPMRGSRRVSDGSVRQPFLSAAGTEGRSRPNWRGRVARRERSSPQSRFPGTPAGRPC